MKLGVKRDALIWRQGKGDGMQMVWKGGGWGVTGHEVPGEARDEVMVTGVHVGCAEASQSRNQSEIE